MGRPSILARAMKDSLGAYKRKGLERIVVPALGAVAAVVVGISQRDNLARALLAILLTVTALAVLVFLWHLLWAARNIIHEQWMQLQASTATDEEFERRYTSLMGDVADVLSQVREIENGRKDLRPRKITARWPEFREVHSVLDDINQYSDYIAADIEKHKIAVPDLRPNAGKLRDACREAERVLREFYRSRTGHGPAQGTSA